MSAQPNPDALTAPTAPPPAAASRQNAVAKAKGFAIADHALSLYAHCTKDVCPNRNK